MTQPEPDSDLSGARARRELSRRLGAALRARHLTLATAESCTGGLLGAVLTDEPGSSDYYLGGAVCYANSVKVGLLQVSAESLARDGAVSEAVAIEMARGARSRLGADLALSTTGIAGPGGGSADKPVGTVWIGVASDSAQSATRYVFPGTRAEVRQAAVSEALRRALDHLGQA